MAQSMLLRRGASAVYCDRILYSGQMLYDIRFMENRAYHLFILESSGVLTVIGSLKGDIWMCGGGGSGTPGTFRSGDSTGTAGAGGGGGYVLNAFNVPIQSGLVTVGAGAPEKLNTVSGNPAIGGSTAYLSYSAMGGQSAYFYNSYPSFYALGGSGGCGGGAPTEKNSGTGAGVSTRPFLSQDMSPQCGGGGAGFTGTSAVKAPGGGSDGGDATPVIRNAETPGPGDGGASGGGGGGAVCATGGSHGLSGHTSSTSANSPGGKGGGFGYGGGGGGGGVGQSNMGHISCGAGAPGAMMIRIPV